jgi:hypothetical protein
MELVDTMDRHGRGDATNSSCNIVTLLGLRVLNNCA